MKFVQLIEYNKRNIFLQTSCKKWGRGTNSRPLFIFLKKIYEVKASGLQFSFNIISIALNLAYNTNNLYKTLDYWYVLNFDFLEEDLAMDSPLHFAYISFQEKSFSCYILLTDQISLSDGLYFLRYWGIFVLQLFVSQVVMSWILKLNLSF